MKTKRVLIAAVVLTAGWLGPASHAGALSVDFQVQVGAINPTNPDAPYEYTRFYPDVLKVRRGQTVRWNFVENLPLGFHAVTYRPAGKPGFWRVDEAGTYAFPEKAWFSSECGRGSQPACVLAEDTEFVSSGAIVNAPLGSPFRVTVDPDLPLGTYTYFCTIHPGMEGTLEVVDDGVQLPTQAEIDADVAEEIAADTAAADALFQAGQVPTSTIEDGQRVWTVLLGDSTDDDHVAIDTFLPSSLPIEPGDRVRFEFRDRDVGPIVNEVHTVTFPNAFPGDLAGLQAFVAFHPACDPDDPETGLRGIPGGWGISGPECPFNTEFLWQPRMSRTTPAPGNLVLTPGTYHDSGAILPEGAPDAYRRLPDTGEYRPSSFEAEFPAPGTFTFACSVHEQFMTGSITAG